MRIDARGRVLIALTVYGEARGQSRLGKAAVAWTILHRAANPRWWGRDPAGCCLAPWQYSCWNKEDPNRARLLSFLQGGDTGAAALTEGAEADAALRECLEIVERVCAGDIPDPTRGATHYFNPKAVASPPRWSAGRRPAATIGAHLFYAGVEPGTKPAVLRPPDPAPALAPTEPALSGGLFSCPRRKA